MYRTPANKKDQLFVIILLGALFLPVFIVFTCLDFKSGIAYLMPTVDIYDEEYDLDNLKETDVIESNIKLLMGKYYGYHYTGNSSDHYYYILPLAKFEAKKQRLPKNNRAQKIDHRKRWF